MFTIATTSCVLWHRSLLVAKLGDGIIGRVCAQLQKRFWRPPEIERKPYGGKYAR